jgi:CheY-like chemotaxis protein
MPALELVRRSLNEPGSSVESARRILLVEDNEVERTGIATILRREGFAVQEAVDGRQALERLQDDRPDLILLDLLLPEVDGWAFLKRVQQEPGMAAVPILIVTAVAVTSSEWARSMGARDLLNKPIDTDELLKKVRRWCP